MGNGDYESTRSLLEDDNFLLEKVNYHIKKGYQHIQNMLHALEVLFKLQSLVSPGNSSTTWSSLYISTMSGELQDSALVKNLILSIKKLSSSILRDLLISFSAFPILDISQILRDLDNLLTAEDPAASPLHGELNTHNRTLRTTVVGQKVSLSHHTSALSSRNQAYSGIVTRFSTHVEKFLHVSLIDPRTLFLHEILIYDLKSPHRDVFLPRPRLAIERALSTPHDYLGCDCCKGLESALAPSQPPTAVLYQLYLECGAIINAADLWAAFYAIMGNQQGEDEEADRERVL